MNLNHLHWPTDGWGYMLPNKDALAAFQYVKENIAPKKILEIGFHAGHSTTYMLEMMNQATVHTIGLGGDLYSMKHLARHQMQKVYQDRFKCEIRSSDHVKELFAADQYDFAFIDGNHSEVAATRDIGNCIKMKIPYLLIDNCEQHQVLTSINKYLQLDFVEGFLYNSIWKKVSKTLEMRLYHVRFDSI
jgi:protein-L-isoaspartate O-methyltransferase